MGDDVKIKKLSTPRKIRKEKSREYLYGPIDTFNVEWANKVVDLKIDVDELHKYRSLSTNDEITSRRQSIASDSLNAPTEVCKGCTELKKELESLKSEDNTTKLYKECERRIEKVKNEMKEMELREKIEHLLNEIYTITSDIFGEDNMISLYLEEYANLYLTYQNNIQMELTSLRSQLEVVNNLDRILNDKTNYNEVIQQKVKIIDSLVEQLKSSKAEANVQVARAQGELESVRNELLEKTKLLNDKDVDVQTFKDLLQDTRTEFYKLLNDQHELISQIPLSTLKIRDCQETLTDNHTAEQRLHVQSECKDVLNALINSLYSKNEEYSKLLEEKEDIILQQQLTIQKLQRSLKEWENDGALWLDYVDQTNITNNN